MNNILKFKKLREDAVVPSYAHEGDSGMDLSAVEPVIVPARGRARASTGIAIQLARGTEAQVRPRSGLGFKHGIVAAFGTVDQSYLGEVQVVLFNHTDADYQVNKFDRIAQLVIAPVERVELREVSEFTETSRGTSGFGSTGK